MKRRPPNVKMKRRTPVFPTEVVLGRTRTNGSFQPWMCEVAKNMVGKLGARNNDLADHFNVSHATIDNWIKNRPEFEQAVKYGRMECLIKASNSLLHRGVGFSHPDVHIMTQTIKEYDENGKLKSSRTEPLIIPITKHYPPDTMALRLYLSNIGREYGWSDAAQVNMDVKHSGDINIHKIEELSMDDLSEELQALLFEVHLKQLSDVQSN